MSRFYQTEGIFALAEATRTALRKISYFRAHSEFQNLKESSFFRRTVFCIGKLNVVGFDLIALIALLLLMYQPLVGHLGRQPFQIWDEARLSRNALEMFMDWQWIVPTFDGVPDMWNSKPPLLIWLQALSFKLFGLNESSFRLPSALAAIATSLLLALFCARYLKSQLLGFVAAVVLITSNGYIVYHGARHGDYDSMLCLWATITAMSFFTYLEKGKPKFLYITCVAVIAGIWTKGITIFMIGPGLLLYAVYKGKLWTLLRSKHLYLGLLSIIVFGVGYYPLRESVNPGFIEAVWYNELGGRYLSVNSENSGNFWYYINQLWSDHYVYWVFFALFGLISSLRHPNLRIRNLAAFAAILGITYLFVISVAKTKLAWYDIPAYPFLAILSALTIYQVFIWLQQSEAPRWVPIVLVLGLLIVPFRDIFMVTYQPSRKALQDYYWMSYYMQDAYHNRVEFKDQLLAFDGYHTQIDFYVEMMRRRGYKCDFTTGDNIPLGSVVSAYQYPMIEKIESTYETQIVGWHGEVRQYQIIGLKN